MLHRAPQLSTRRKKGHYANEYWNPRVQQVQSQSQGSDAASTVGVASTVGPSASQVAPSTASTQKRIARVEIDIGQRIPTIWRPCAGGCPGDLPRATASSVQFAAVQDASPRKGGPSVAAKPAAKQMVSAKVAAKPVEKATPKEKKQPPARRQPAICF